MNLRALAGSLIVLAGLFVAGSEIWDLLLEDERSFTVDHFLLGITTATSGAAMLKK